MNGSNDALKIYVFNSYHEHLKKIRQWSKTRLLMII